MRYLRCTQKLLKEIGVNRFPENAVSDNQMGLGDWYVNLLRIDRRKCLLFTNENTLFSFLIPKVLKKHILDMQNEFRVNLIYNLRYEGIDTDLIPFVEQEYSNIEFGKTKSKSVLASMNDIARYLRHVLSDPRLTKEPELGDLNRQLNRMPSGVLAIDIQLKL